MIWEELRESLILTEVETENSDDVMKVVGGALIQEGYAKQSYIEALIEREKEFPTGLDIDGIGVAIPHTDVSHVLQDGIAIAVLKKPVTFFQMGTDDDKVEIGLVFMLSVLDPKGHIEQLQRIVSIIQDKQVLSNLLKEKDKRKIIEIIKEKEATL